MVGGWKQRGFILALYYLFVLSGVSGLIYESLWARYLGLFVGHTAYAQIIVLAIFLGGMSLGAYFISSRSRRIQDPLQWYGRIELLIGVIGFVFHPVFTFTTSTAYDFLFPALGNGSALLIGRWLISALLILPQSILLGATFPLMSAAVLRRVNHHPGRILSTLYFANSFGAAVGILLTGFCLLAFVGLPGTLLIASGINLFVALLALVIAQAFSLPLSETPGIQAPENTMISAPTLITKARLQPLLLGVAFGTAISSFIYEIGWIRMLSLVFGSATHSFELMLSAFILGLALGSFWVRKHADRWTKPIQVLGLLQWIMGASALATLPLYSVAFEWMALLMQTFAKTDAGYTGFSFARYSISLAVMLPATFCAGATLPLITRILISYGIGERAIGQTYGINTLGSIVGVILAALVLLPWLGLKDTLIVGATLDMVLGAIVLLTLANRQMSSRRLALGAVAATVVVVGLTISSKDFDSRLLTSTVFREGKIPQPGEYESLFHHDGRTATVSVQRYTKSGSITILTNGKPDASLPTYWNESCSSLSPRRLLDGDMATQALAPLITLAHAPKARTGVIIGQGSGMSSHFVLGSPHIKELVTVEIEPAIVHGSRLFFPANRRVFEDSRSKIVIDDAKSYFAAAQQRFDLIFSEPSNPWVSGVSSLFTTEFYQRIRQYLSPDGVFGQWLHLYELNDELTLTVLAAIHANFRSYEVFQAFGANIIIIASNQPSLPQPDWTVFQHSAIAQDLCHNFPFTPRMLEAARLLRREELSPLLDSWRSPNSDFQPTLDLYAERARYLHLNASGVQNFSGVRFHILAPFFDRVSSPTNETLAPVHNSVMRKLAISAQLRKSEGNTILAVESQDSLTAIAHYQVALWRAAILQNQAPADWQRWLEDFRTVEGHIHGGVFGVADEIFYQDVWSFLDRVNAPKFVRNVVAFRHGLAAWDFAEASQAGDKLLQSVLDRKGYLPTDEYLDGMVVAKLRLGAIASARHIFEAVAPLDHRGRNNLSIQLLGAYIRVANQHEEFSPNPNTQQLVWSEGLLSLSVTHQEK